MDETLAQDGTLAQALRDAQAKLDAAREDAEALRALLALRTHQHDAAWQSARRLEAELAAARAAEAPAGASAGGREREDEAAEAASRAREETEAVRTVLHAVLDCLGRRALDRALDRRRFQEIVARAGREAPAEGPGAARHAVLLAEARRVLGVTG